MQQLARELDIVRNHNKSFRQSDPQHLLLLHAEAGLVCTALEHFVRIVLGPDAKDRDTLGTLLTKAVDRKLIKLPFDDEHRAIADICGVRNSLLHGNFAQAARLAKKASVAEYFKTDFAPELERLYKITDCVIAQIDPATGKPNKSPP